MMSKGRLMMSKGRLMMSKGRLMMSQFRADLIDWSVWSKKVLKMRDK